MMQPCDRSQGFSRSSSKTPRDTHRGWESGPTHHEDSIAAAHQRATARVFRCKTTLSRGSLAGFARFLFFIQSVCKS